MAKPVRFTYAPRAQAVMAYQVYAYDLRPGEQQTAVKVLAAYHIGITC